MELVGYRVQCNRFRRRTSKRNNPMSVVIFGSINMDMVVRTPRLPAPGET